MSRHRSYINLGLSACLGVSLSAIAADGPTVHVYNWYDYIGPTTLQDFKRDTGIQPVYDTFDSAEALEGKLLTSRSGYDVVVASNFSLPTLIKAGALAPLPRNQMPDFKNMDNALLAKLANNYPGNQYAGLTWGGGGRGGWGRRDERGALGGGSDHLSYPNGNRSATPLVAEATRNNPAVYLLAEAMATLFTLQPLPPATERVRTRICSKVKNGQ